MLVIENGPTAANLPTPQVEHTFEEVAPTALEPVPAGHAVQKVLASAAEYLPALHGEHGAAPREYRPAAQLSQALEAFSEPEPAEHPTHEFEDTEPVSARYFPAGQLVQAEAPTKVDVGTEVVTVTNPLFDDLIRSDSGAEDPLIAISA